MFQLYGDSDDQRNLGPAGVVMLMTASVANAAVSDEEFQALRQQLQQALQRLDQLEQQNTTLAQL